MSKFTIGPMQGYGGRTARELFLRAPAWDRVSSPSPDKFAHTFVSKADMQDNWSQAQGAFETGTGELMGAIITTVSKREPKVANLQLLHTFAVHRRKGVARALVERSLAVHADLARYFRVSSEPDSVDFYRSCGLKFWGRQKSGTLLCIGRFDGGFFRELTYDDCDPVIRAAVFSQRRGGVVEHFPTPN